MIDLALTLPSTWNWLLPVIFGLGTGLPIMLLAWIISYSAISAQTLTERMQRFEHWFRFACAVLFLAYGIYLGYTLMNHDHHHHDCCYVQSVLQI